MSIGAECEELVMAMTDWRFCHKCNSLFFDGHATKGACAAGGAHEAQGLEFKLTHGTREDAHRQAGWRFCTRCRVMFFDGSPENGRCAAGGQHAGDAKFDFVLPHDVAERFPASQTSWRCCSQCLAMFFDGFPAKGTCPAGGGHAAQGFVFVLPTTSVIID